MEIKLKQLCEFKKKHENEATRIAEASISMWVRKAPLWFVLMLVTYLVSSTVVSWTQLSAINEKLTIVTEIQNQVVHKLNLR